MELRSFFQLSEWLGVADAVAVLGEDRGASWWTSVRNDLPGLAPVDHLILVVLFTLPLTSALTIDVGFPLKIYEVLLALVFLYTVTFAPAAQWRQRLCLNRAERLGALAFLCIMVVSLAVNAALGARPADPGIYRFGPVVDGFTQVAYFVLAVFATIRIAELTARVPRVTTSAWLLGAVFASLYSLWHVGATLLGQDAPDLPAAVPQVMFIENFRVVRSGTFAEGNFLAVYLLVSTAIALVSRRWLIACLATAALYTTISTVPVLAVMALWVGVLLRVLLRRLPRDALWAVGAVLLVSLTLPLDYYQSLILNKLGISLVQEDSIEGGPAAGGGEDEERFAEERQQVRMMETRSASERLATATAAKEMFVDHPLLGVGPAQFGLWFSRYRPEWLPPSFLAERSRYIPNNVYLQILAEQGLLGAAALGVFALSLGRRVIRIKNWSLWLALLGLLAALNAYPTYLLMFLWAFAGWMIGLDERVRREQPAVLP